MVWMVMMMIIENFGDQRITISRQGVDQGERQPGFV